MNLTDKMYFGKYRGKYRHENDMSRVLQRAWDNGVSKIIITGVKRLNFSVICSRESKTITKISRTGKAGSPLVFNGGCSPDALQRIH